jgi:hypothetical protein
VPQGLIDFAFLLNTHGVNVLLSFIGQCHNISNHIQSTTGIFQYSKKVLPSWIRTLNHSCAGAISTTLQGTKEEYGHLRNHVLLDNQSTADIFCNLNFLQNIRKVQETLTLYTNGGVLECNTKGDLKGYGTVWCHPEAIANVPGLSNVLDTGRYKVTFDVDEGFTMKNTITGATTVFKRDNDGLFSAPLGPAPYKNT